MTTAQTAENFAEIRTAIEEGARVWGKDDMTFAAKVGKDAIAAGENVEFWTEMVDYLRNAYRSRFLKAAAPAAPLVQAPLAPAPAKSQPKLYDGYYTVVLADGHVTFKVREDSFSWMTNGKPAPGTRWIGYLAGQDNESDTSYKGCGFVRPDGTITPWGKFRGGRIAEAMGVLAGDVTGAGRAYAMESQRCSKCNRLLTNAESLEAYKIDGLGPICRENVWK
jgi:hypothetical protein